MVDVRGLDAFPRDHFADYPVEIREANRRRARAFSALRLYRRRGWNDSAVRLQHDRESANLKQLLDHLVFAEENPTLF
uniref:Uncharacterized protein n=1 Tax=uncultured prokaryote TaxID=198431 RepID=A0A0H5Q4Z3_9ZZZZ|nr:hypothetical protein [uncultured prokaryote]